MQRLWLAISNQFYRYIFTGPRRDNSLQITKTLNIFAGDRSYPVLRQDATGMSGAAFTNPELELLGALSGLVALALEHADLRARPTAE